MRKTLYIFRGAPGSGKSTLAAKTAPIVIEPDQFRYQPGMKYVHDASENAKVMRQTARYVLFALRELRVPEIAVTAMFTRIEHMTNHIAAAKRNKYDVVVVECYGQFENTHGVPASVVAAARKHFEPVTPEIAAQLGISEVRTVNKGE